MNKNLLKSLLVGFIGLSSLTVAAQEVQTGSADVKMTYIDNSNAETAMGEIAAGNTARAGYNKISGGSIGWANAGWGCNWVTYIQVDASAIEGTITAASLSLEVSGSSDSKRAATYGVGYNSSAWSAEMTAATADLSITTCGATYTSSTKSAETFETATFDIIDAFNNDAEGDKVVTILVYATNAGGGIIQNPSVTVEYSNAATANYTVKYVDASGNEIKDAVTRLGFVGQAGEVNVDDMASFINAEGTVKYIYSSDDLAGQTVAEDGSTVITVTFREAATWSYTVNATVAEQTLEIATGSNFEGETITFHFPKFVNVDGTIYEIPSKSFGSGYYEGSFALTEDGQVYTVTGYNLTATSNCVYYAEAENIATLTQSTAANMAIRCSNGLGAYNGGEAAATIVTLNPGTYTLTTSVWGGTGVTFVFKAGETTIGSFDCFGYIQDYTSDEFTLTERTDITLDPTTNAARCIDYVMITGTGSVFDINSVPTVENIAGLSAITGGNEVILTLNQAYVTFVKDDIAFIQDETGAVKTSGLGLTEGTVLNGTVTATYNTAEGELPVLTASSLTNTENYWAVDEEFIPAIVPLDVLQPALASYAAQVVRITQGETAGILGSEGLVYSDYTAEGKGYVLEDQFLLNTIGVSDDYSVLPEGYTWPEVIGNAIVVVGVNGVSPISAEKIYAPGEGFGTVVANIAEMKAQADQDAVALTLNNAQVTFSMQNMLGQTTIIIEDATGAAQILSEAMAWSPYPEPDIATTFPEAFGTVGNVLNGTLYGKFVNAYGTTGIAYNGYTSMSSITATAGELNPTVSTIPEMQTEANSWRLFRLENVTISFDEANYAYTITDGTNTMTYNDMYGLMVDAETYEYITGDFKYVDGLLYYDTLLDTPAYMFIPTGSYEVAPEQVYKSFEATTVLAGDEATITAAAAEGWVKHGTFVTNKKGNIDINTGEVVDAAQMPGVAVKNLGHSSKYFYTYVTNVSEAVAYASSTSSSATRTLHVVATPTDGSEAVTVAANAAPNETGVATLTLNPAKEYEIVYYGTETKEDGSIAAGDMVVFGVKFVVAEVTGRKWDFTTWSTATLENLAADAADVVDVTAAETGWRTFEKNGGPTESDPDKGGACYWYGSLISEPMELSANGVVIAETAGLLFNNVVNTNNTIGIAVNYPETGLGTYAGPSYLWLNGDGRQITIPAVIPGSTIKMGVESHRAGDGRGVDLSVDGVQFATCTPDAYEEFEWTVPTSEAETVDVLVASNKGCHIYYIEVNNPGGVSDGIEAINPVKVQNDNVYTLGGVMVRKAGQSLEGLAKGIYIMGGKKIVIK